MRHFNQAIKHRLDLKQVSSSLFSQVGKIIKKKTILMMHSITDAFVQNYATIIFRSV